MLEHCSEIIFKHDVLVDFAKKNKSSIVSSGFFEIGSKKRFLG